MRIDPANVSLKSKIDLGDGLEKVTYIAEPAQGKNVKFYDLKHPFLNFLKSLK